MRVEGGVEDIKGSWFLEKSSKGQSKVGGGTGMAVVAKSRGRHLVNSYGVKWNDQQIIATHWGGHGLPVPLFFDSICLSAVGPGASHPQEDSQELQLECSKWEGVWYTSTRQSAFPADIQSLGGFLFECT